MTQNLDQFNFPAAVVPCRQLARTPEGKVDQMVLRALFVKLLL